MSAAASPVIEAQHVSIRLDGRMVLHDVSVAIQPGEIVTIVGPNGSGKSSFLKALIGAVPLESGDIRRAPHHG